MLAPASDCRPVIAAILSSLSLALRADLAELEGEGQFSNAGHDGADAGHQDPPARSPAKPKPAQSWGVRVVGMSVISTSISLTVRGIARPDAADQRADRYSDQQVDEPGGDLRLEGGIGLEWHQHGDGSQQRDDPTEERERPRRIRQEYLEQRRGHERRRGCGKRHPPHTRVAKRPFALGGEYWNVQEAAVDHDPDDSHKSGHHSGGRTTGP